MASYNELHFDWSMLCQESKNWTLSDLQLAAELGKTLLERNKELESDLRQHQAIINDQAQEIEYLTKQTAALREVNDSRLRMYENIEISISDLERANHRLVLENSADKKHIKTLCHTVETLESRCEELVKQNEDLNKIIAMDRRKKERQQNRENGWKDGAMKSSKSRQDNHDSEPETEEASNANVRENSSHSLNSSNNHELGDLSSLSVRLQDVVDFPTNGTIRPSANSTEDSIHENEELLKLMSDLNNTKKELMCEQQRNSEMEEQLISIIQENQTLQGRLANSNANEEMKSIHDELSILEEVRQGQMCSRCLRMVDDKNLQQDEDDGLMGVDAEDDDRSLIELISSQKSDHVYRPPPAKEVSKPDSLDLAAAPVANPYRVLVERYEALMEEQKRRSQVLGLTEDSHMSGDYSSIHTKDTDEESATGSGRRTAQADNGKSTGARRKTTLRTPTDFSETETTSSGYSDETSNKSTQTDERAGSFLCTIADGEDCKFSIYDDASPIGSRFRNRPEYRELFKEIFAVLKKAAENRDEGDKLPLLDDTHPPTDVKVPPVTPATEDLPEIQDDAISVTSSMISEQSVAMSECITKTERRKIEQQKKHANQENKPPIGQIVEDGRILTPYKRQPLEYLSVSVNVKKKHRKNRRNHAIDRSDSPAGVPSPPKVFYATGSGRKRRDMRPVDLAHLSPSGFEWPGKQASNRGVSQSPSTPSTANSSRNELDTSAVEFRPSTASQDLQKLKKLDLSYAEVLRRADKCQHQHWRKNQNQHHNSGHRHYQQSRR
ncbi:cerebellar degeneration-related protein 2-like isoform X2 [Phlebotomus papatasi]|uniref:cerebellar degeneration-related protein 2-like isoform X2 n=1 Tax=Phlebotomus papatasi TaxID=29031 RepID=UPI00248346D5|nr:cerebellar degeneration-related protein 2-like isoform X2 [Phlebotomus papatasi]